ncbi:MAG: YhjD/YihY/BrkB family envelope integrity protein [Kribbellaceae bacterium]
MRRQWAEHPLVRRVKDSVAGRIVFALLEIRLYDRALTIAGQAFIALVPLMIVLATLLSSADAAAVADWLISRFDLSGSSADAVQSLFGRPPSASGGLTIISVITVLISASSFARSVQRTYEVAWNLPARGLRKTVDGLSGAALLLLLLVVLAYLASLVSQVPGGRLVSLIGQLAIAIPAWCLVTWLLLSRRVSRRLLLPGAVVSAVAQVVLSWAGSIYVPHLIERNIDRYGVIGVAIALISWLVVAALVIVVSAVIGAQLGALLADRDEPRD